LKKGGGNARTSFERGTEPGRFKDAEVKKNGRISKKKSPPRKKGKKGS